MLRTPPKDEVTVTEILSKAKEVFQQYGFVKSTMEDIARALGKGKSTLYYYFDSKEDIFEQVVDQEMRHFFGEIEKAVEKAGSARQKLKAYGKVRLKRIRKMCNLSHALKNDLIENLVVVLEIKRKHESAHSSLVNGIFEFGMRRGEFRKINGWSAEQLSTLFVMLFKGMEIPLCSGQVPPNVFELSESMVDVFVEGIGNPDYKPKDVWQSLSNI